MANTANSQKIRNKRLAKLGSQASTQSPDDGEGSTNTTVVSQPSPADAPPTPVLAEQEPLSKPKINISSSPDASIPSLNPFSQLVAKQTAGGASKINIMPAGGRPVTPKKRQSSSSGRPSPRSEGTPEQWEDRILSNTFRITLDLDHRLDSHGHHMQFLKGTRDELEEQNEPVRLNTGLLDQALLEAASNLKAGTLPLDYLLSCWKRVSRHYKALRKGGEQDPKFNVIKEARRLCMSYCIFAITMPDMFG